jgi:hypothetical protein
LLGRFLPLRPFLTPLPLAQLALLLPPPLVLSLMLPPPLPPPLSPLLPPLVLLLPRVLQDITVPIVAPLSPAVNRSTVGGAAGLG